MGNDIYYFDASRIYIQAILYMPETLLCKRKVPKNERIKSAEKQVLCLEWSISVGACTE